MTDVTIPADVAKDIAAYLRGRVSFDDATEARP